MIINLPDLPDDPIERIHALVAAEAEVREEFLSIYAEAYFDARLQRRLEDALQAGPHGRKRVLAWTRAINNARARMVRWNDGLDPESTNYTG